MTLIHVHVTLIHVHVYIIQDGLLSSGYTDFINKVHAKLPQVSPEGRRLQVGVVIVSMVTVNYYISDGCVFCYASQF